MISTDAATRKGLPVATGVLDYFPDVFPAVAELSKIGNDQHNPGKPLQWDRSKSGDESDALMRHFLERGTVDSDGVRHSTKVVWRAMAMLQKELEEAAKKPLVYRIVEGGSRTWRIEDPSGRILGRMCRDVFSTKAAAEAAFLMMPRGHWL